MSYASRLEAQNDRIRRAIAEETTKLGDNRDFLTEDQLWSIWMRQAGDVESKTELDEFQECVPSPDLARNMYSAIKTISILVCIHWDQWDEFAARFCRLTDITTLDDIPDIDARLPFTRTSLGSLLFPGDPYYADNFFLQQYVFLPLVLQENQKFKFYEAGYRLPILNDSIDERGGRPERIIPIKIVAGNFRFARGGELNSVPRSLRWKTITESPEVDQEIQNLACLKSADEMNDRIMRHIVALKIGHEYNVFYDEAELDLATLLNGGYHPHYADSAMAPKPIVGEAWYLAGALHFLHHRLADRRRRIFCYHMDLKPANILIVRNAGSQVGKWMLSDFGVSVVKVEPRSGCQALDMYGDDGQTLLSITQSTRHFSEYRPPETDGGMTMTHGADDGREGDIWSFGCILTELFLFCLGGVSLVRKLRTMDKCERQTNFSFSIVGAGALEYQIRSWASQDDRCQGPWVSGWLQVIFEYALRTSPTERLHAESIQQYLDSIWRQAPTENIWTSPSKYLQVPWRPQSRANSPDWPQSTVSMQSSGPTAQSSFSELKSAATLNRGQGGEIFITVQSPPPVDLPDLSPRRSTSTGTLSSGSDRDHPIDEINLRDEHLRADDYGVRSESARVVFWHGQSVIIYSPERPLFSRESGAIVHIALEAKLPSRWIDVSLSASYLALASLSPSSIQVKVIDLHKGQDVQPNTDWPSFQGLRSVCISSFGSLALVYDKAVTFRSAGSENHLQNSAWGTRSESICSASFSQEGDSFFAISWTKLWIGSVIDKKWILRASGDHLLSVRNHVSFKPYLVPFSRRKALIAHNPTEDRLRFLEAETSTPIELGEGVIRVALAESEDVLIYIRKLQRIKRFSSKTYYGLSWRSIGRFHAGVMTLGAESATIDLNITVEKNKKFSLTSSTEKGTIVAWVATAKGEIRKCSLA